MARRRAPLGALLATTLVSTMVASACSLIPTDDQPRALTPLPEPEEREESTSDTLAVPGTSTMVCVYLWDRAAGDGGGGALFPQRVSGAVNDTADARLRALVALDNDGLDDLVEADGRRSASDIETYVPAELSVVSVRRGGDDLFVVTLSEELDQAQRSDRLYAQLVYTATVGEPQTGVQFRKANPESDTLDDPVLAIVPPGQEEQGAVTRADYGPEFAPPRADVDDCESPEAAETTTSAASGFTDGSSTTAPPTGGAAAAVAGTPAEDTAGGAVTTSTIDEDTARVVDDPVPAPTTAVEEPTTTTTVAETTTTTAG